MSCDVQGAMKNADIIHSIKVSFQLMKINGDSFF